MQGKEPPCVMEGTIVKRINALNVYQKVVLLVVLVLAVVFSVLYPVTLSREGYLYEDTILVPSQENGSVVYAGKIRGEQARFTVSEDKTVTYQYGGQTYGPYTAKEDPTAVPEGVGGSSQMTGVELRCGERVVFRGGVMILGGNYILHNADGSVEDIGVPWSFGEEAGTDPAAQEPTAAAILQVMAGPELTHKGDDLYWFFGMICCVLTVCTVLFADELFRWDLHFRIRHVEGAEPSDWEILRRYFVWTLFPVLALVAFVLGLQ